MNEVKITVEGINAMFENAGALHRLRESRPDLFSYSHGILMLKDEQTGSQYRVVLPIRDEDLIGIKQAQAE